MDWRGPELKPGMDVSVRVDWRLLAFYGGVPLVVGLYGALNNLELIQLAGYGGSLGFYAAHSFIPWWITCVSTSLVMQLLARWKPRPILIMLAGSVIGCVLTLPYSNWVTAAFGEVWPGETFRQLSAGAFSMNFWGYLARATIVWIGINYIFDRFVGLPRYRYEIPPGFEASPADAERKAEESAAESATAGQQPPFLLRLPVKLTMDEIVFIKAEQHYIRVATSEREYMVLYRFSDALQQIDPDIGLQVHRSWWVARDAIATLHTSAKRFFIRLANGTEVPVSTPYQGLVREFSRSASIPTKPVAAANA